MAAGRWLAALNEGKRMGEEHVASWRWQYSGYHAHCHGTFGHGLLANRSVEHAPRIGTEGDKSERGRLKRKERKERAGLFQVDVVAFKT